MVGVKPMARVVEQAIHTGREQPTEPGEDSGHLTQCEVDKGEHLHVCIIVHVHVYVQVNGIREDQAMEGAEHA